MSEEAGTHFAGRMGYLEPFDESSSDWASYDERLTSFLIVNGVPESEKVHAFLSIIGPKTYALLKSLTAPELPSTKSFKHLKKALGDHLSPNRPSSLSEPSFTGERNMKASPFPSTSPNFENCRKRATMEAFWTSHSATASCADY